MNATPEALLFEWTPASHVGGATAEHPAAAEQVRLAFDPAGDVRAQVEEAMRALNDAAAGSPLFGMVAEHLATGGKRVRATLAVEAARAAGAPYEASVWWGAACELLHNATLVHDDLQDGDAVRRGQPALWARYGAAQAINAGDLMLMLAYGAVARMDLDAGARASLADCLSRRTVETACGQAREIELTERGVPCWDTYLHAAMGKTGQFFAMPIEGALLCAGRTGAEAQRIGDAFAWVGVLFQIIDDVVDLYGAKGRGQSGADIREGKLSALVIQHLKLVPSDEAWLLRVLRADRHETTDEDVARVRQAFVDSGALGRTLDLIRRGERYLATHPQLEPAPQLQAMACAVLGQAARSIRPLLDEAPVVELAALRNA